MSTATPYARRAGRRTATLAAAALALLAGCAGPRSGDLIPPFEADGSMAAPADRIAIAERLTQDLARRRPGCPAFEVLGARRVSRVEDAKGEPGARRWVEQWLVEGCGRQYVYWVHLATLDEGLLVSLRPMENV